jgi:hypothetical protein
MKIDPFVYMSIVDLKDKLEKMNKSQQIELARMLIHEYRVTYDENQNGIFINMSELPPSILEKIRSFLKYIELQEENITNVEREMNGLKDTFFKTE